jgi:hypothetical protein
VQHLLADLVSPATVRDCLSILNFQKLGGGLHLSNGVAIASLFDSGTNPKVRATPYAKLGQTF